MICYTSQFGFILGIVTTVILFLIGYFMGRIATMNMRGKGDRA